MILYVQVVVTGSWVQQETAGLRFLQWDPGAPVFGGFQK